MSGQLATLQTQLSAMQINLTPLLSNVSLTISHNTPTISHWLVPYAFWRSYCSNILVQIIEFLNDFSNASQRARQLDQKILQDAASVSGRLGDLVSLAVPQVYGSSQLTIGTDDSGKLDKSDVMMFTKDIGGSSPK